ncbi:DUF2059 domain-containing protein [Roseobacteraceae bacterium S113]
MHQMTAFLSPSAWRATAFCTATLVALSGPAVAQSTQAPSARATDALLDLIGLQETIAIMQVEGAAYAHELAAEMLPAAPGALWKETVARIYDADRMIETVRAGFAQSYLANDITTAPLERFFGSELGRDIIRLEISAREAMSEQEIEDAARAIYRDRVSEAGESDPRLTQLRAFVDANDLIEANVVGGMNSTVRFYQGLADGGMLQLSEGEILAEVWGSEEETRLDTVEWIYGYLLMAYKPLTDAQLADYAAMAATPEGRAMNAALFAGFDAMYNDVSYALGRAIAGQIGVQDL